MLASFVRLFWKHQGKQGGGLTLFPRRSSLHFLYLVSAHTGAFNRQYLIFDPFAGLGLCGERGDDQASFTGPKGSGGSGDLRRQSPGATVGPGRGFEPDRGGGRGIPGRGFGLGGMGPGGDPGRGRGRAGDDFLRGRDMPPPNFSRHGDGNVLPPGMRMDR